MHWPHSYSIILSSLHHPMDSGQQRLFRTDTKKDRCTILRVTLALISDWWFIYLNHDHTNAGSIPDSGTANSVSYWKPMVSLWLTAVCSCANSFNSMSSRKPSANTVQPLNPLKKPKAVGMQHTCTPPSSQTESHVFNTVWPSETEKKKLTRCNNRHDNISVVSYKL